MVHSIFTLVTVTYCNDEVGGTHIIDSFALFISEIPLKSNTELRGRYRISGFTSLMTPNDLNKYENLISTTQSRISISLIIFTQLFVCLQSWFDFLSTYHKFKC